MSLVLSHKMRRFVYRNATRMMRRCLSEWTHILLVGRIVLRFAAFMLHTGAHPSGVQTMRLRSTLLLLATLAAVFAIAMGRIAVKHPPNRRPSTSPSITLPPTRCRRRCFRRPYPRPDAQDARGRRRYLDAGPTASGPRPRRGCVDARLCSQPLQKPLGAGLQLRFPVAPRHSTCSIFHSASTRIGWRSAMASRSRGGAVG